MRRAVVIAACALAAPGIAALALRDGPRPRDRHRIELDVETHGRGAARSVGSVELDLDAAVAARGGSGAADPDTIEVVALDGDGNPRAFDVTLPAEERALLPWRVERHYAKSRVTLRFAVPDGRSRRYVVSFDATGGGRESVPRYPGLVGDGDLFRLERGRREIAASANDTFADIDGDGDLDLLQGGVEPFVRVYENAGGGRFEPRGRLTSDGQPLVFHRDEGNRSWLSVEAADWDGDGDQDLFVFYLSGPFINRVVPYEDVSAPGGAPSFRERPPLATTGGAALAGRVAFTDWDGDGRLDVMCSTVDGLVAFHRNVGESREVARIAIADGLPLRANGVELLLDGPRPDFADLDADGDLDVFVGTEDGPVYFFENLGTRAAPALGLGRVLAWHGYMDAKTGVKVADFDGDGLLDVAVGRFWQRTTHGDRPIVHGRLLRNVGTARAPRFESRDAAGGAPFTEAFHPLDAVRQNSVLAADWDGDGHLDLLAGDTDGYVWLFRNLGRARSAPLFAAGVRLQAAGGPVRVLGEEREARAAGYARPDVADWNGDGRLDLLVADGRGWLTWFPGTGAAGAPALGPGRRLSATGRPIDGTARGSVRVVDFDADGRLDVLFAMVGEGPSRHYDWPALANADRSRDRGVLFYRNVGTGREPLLAAPRWVRLGAEGAEADILRPNLGDFVDWDGDGARDLIVCEFENACRVFRNTTGGGPGRRPLFADPAATVTVLAPWTAQMISGARAVDWDGDGALDLITGQGHGGSGLRFYARGFVDDVVNGTLPRVTVVPGDGGAR